MLQVRVFFSLVRWDIAVELRRREATLNMCLFAVLVLFIGSYAVSIRTELQDNFGPVFYWVAIVFSGTVGLSRAFLVEKENGAFQGLLMAPVDPGLIYMAKVLATWLYVLIMAFLVMGAYLVLFDFDLQDAAGHIRWDPIGKLSAVTASFCLAYVGAGILLAAMTTNLRGGEVVLRTLLFPLMVPAIITALKANETIFILDPARRVSPMSPWISVAALLALAAIYLSSCFLLFAKVVEE